MEGSPQAQINARNVFFTEGKLLIVVVSGSIGVMIWIFSSVLGPLNLLKDQVTNLRDNHIHTLEVKQDQMQASISAIAGNIIQLQTILDERLPTKK
jgi:hypothetical protein